MFDGKRTLCQTTLNKYSLQSSMIPLLKWTTCLFVHMTACDFFVCVCVCLCVGHTVANPESDYQFSIGKSLAFDSRSVNKSQLIVMHYPTDVCQQFRYTSTIIWERSKDSRKMSRKPKIKLNMPLSNGAYVNEHRIYSRFWDSRHDVIEFSCVTSLFPSLFLSLGWKTCR